MSTDFNRESKKDPDQLEREIDEQRAHIGDTLAALEERFSPGQLLDQALRYGPENGGEFSRNLVDTIKYNPIPTVMTAVGVAWMIYGQSRPPSTSASRYRKDYDSYDRPSNASYGLDPDYDYDYGASADYGVSGSGRDWLTDDKGNRTQDLKHRAGEKTDELKHKAEDMTDEMKRKAAHLKDNVTGSLQNMRGRANQSAHGASDGMRRAGSSMRGQAQRARSGISYLVEEQPLALGAVGLAIGALIGASIHATRKEDELMGAQRDRLADQANEKAENLYEKASDVGQKVAADIKADVQNLKDDVKSDVKDDLSAAQHSSNKTSPTQSPAPKH